MKTVKIHVKGMHCRSCELLLQDSIAELPGIGKVHASHTKGEVAVTYDESKVKEAQILAAINKEGYQA